MYDSMWQSQATVYYQHCSSAVCIHKMAHSRVIQWQSLLPYSATVYGVIVSESYGVTVYGHLVSEMIIQCISQWA